MPRLSTIACAGNEIDYFQCSLFISEEGDVYSKGCGINNSHGHPQHILIPKVIDGLKQIISVVSKDYTMFLDSNGTVYTLGKEIFGDFDSNLPSWEPYKLDLPPIKQIACCKESGFCVSEIGEVFSFGNNENGQLGHGNYDVHPLNYPKKIESLENIDFIECGSQFVICKNFDNSIFSWGRNDSGQLGTTTQEYSPTKCETWNIDISEIIDITCGYNHTLVLMSNKYVYSCGYNFSGQVGRLVDNTSLERIDELSDVVKIECGDNHSLCINSNGNLYVFGDNHCGQLGLGDTENRKTPIKHPSLSNIIDISRGGSNTFVKTSNNEIYAFGFCERVQEERIMKI